MPAQKRKPSALPNAAAADESRVAQRSAGRAADDGRPRSEAPGEEGAKVMSSWAAALAAPIAGARSQADELARMRERGLDPDLDDTDGGWTPASPPEAKAGAAGRVRDVAATPAAQKRAVRRRERG